jgi:long-chain acyl-CoA synthetase
MNKKSILYSTKEFRDVREVIENTVKQYPENIAFIIKEKQKEKVNYKNITYKMLQYDINKLGTALIDMGLQGKRIAIIANNRYEWCLSYLTTLCGVGIVVPMDKSLPAGEIESLLKRSYANAVIFEDKYSNIMLDIKKNSTNNIEYYISMDTPKENEILSLRVFIRKGRKIIKKWRYKV